MIDSSRACRVLASAPVWLGARASRAIKRFLSRLLLAGCLVMMSGPIAGQPPQQQEETKIPTKEYAQTYSQSFKGSDVSPEGWRYISALAEERVQFEEAGLRIKLPPGGPELGQTVGIRSAFGVKGDFEITLSFEALKDPDPADVGKAGTRFGLSLNLDTPLLDTPQAEVATLNRSMATKGFSTWARTRHRPTPHSHGFPTPATTGRLRMVRSGEELFYLASVGADQPLVFLQKYRFGAEDLHRVGIFATTGGEKAMIDMRVTDFRIRADSIPNAPELETAQKPQIHIAHAPEDRNGWLIVIALIVGLAIVVLVMLGCILLARRSVAKPATANARISNSFACPQCGTVLKTKAEMAGKKVKCPKCGAAVPVPTTKPDEAQAAI